MIKNRRQYNATKKQIDKLKAAIEVAHQTTVQMPKEIFEAMIAGIQSQIQDMEQEICEYDNLSKANILSIYDFNQVGPMLIQTRVAKGLSQAELAERCGLQPQQIQRYEDMSYTTANLERLADIVKALDVSFSAAVGFCNQPTDSLNTGWDLTDTDFDVSHISVQENRIDILWPSLTPEVDEYKYKKAS